MFSCRGLRPPQEVPVAGFSNPRADLKCCSLAAVSQADVALRGNNAPASRACGAGLPRRATPANTKGSPSGEPFVLRKSSKKVCKVR